VNIHQTLTRMFPSGVVGYCGPDSGGLVAVRGVREDSAPANGGEPPGGTTRQLCFSYRPVIADNPNAPVTAGLLEHWLHERSVSGAIAQPVAGFRGAAGAMTKMDRFFLGHAASVLKDLQSKGFAGSAVIHLSIAGLADPLLPMVVARQLQRRGVSAAGVIVTRGPRLPQDRVRVPRAKSSLRIRGELPSPA